MFNKLKLLLVAALVAVSLLVTAPAAFAAEGAAPAAVEAGARWGGGEVVAVGTDSFTVRNPAGEHVVNVDASTHYFDSDGQPAAFADIHIGDRVRGVVTRLADGELYARLIVIFPPQTEYQGVGVITAVHADERAFDFVNRRGKLWEFYVDDATLITNRAGDGLSFADLQARQRAFVKAELRSDGKWWALEVKIARHR